MGIVKGKHLTGAVGSVVYRNDNGKTIVSKRPSEGKMKQTAATKQTATFFGFCSRIGSLVRSRLLGSHFSDRYMSNRVTVAIRSTYARAYHKGSGTYVFGPDSFDGMIGLEFNIKSKLSDYFWVKPEMFVKDDEMTLHIPEIKVLRDMKFPSDATLCEPYIFFLVFSPESGYYDEQILNISKVQHIDDLIPAQELKLYVPKGCVCLSSLHANYFKVDGDVKTPMNINRSFDPSGICGAVVNPGVFSHADLKGNKSNWSLEKKISAKVLFRMEGDADPIDELEKAVVQENLEAAPKMLHIKSRPKKEKTEAMEIPNDSLAERIKAARTMKRYGIPLAQILEATKLTVEEIIDGL